MRWVQAAGAVALVGALAGCGGVDAALPRPDVVRGVGVAVPAAAQAAAVSAAPTTSAAPEPSAPSGPSGPSGPAATDLTPDETFDAQDKQFVTRTASFASTVGDATQRVIWGRSSCTVMRTWKVKGLSPQERRARITNALAGYFTALGADGARRFAGIAIEVYCPDVAG